MAKEKPTDDFSKKIREAQVKNILAKLRDGKTISAREAKIAEEFAAEKDGKPKKLTQQDVADAWGMTQPNVAKMVKQGMPLDSMEAAVAWRKDFLARKGRGDNAPEGYQEARTRKALLECERLEMQLAILRGDYTLTTEVREDGLRIGNILTAKLNTFVADSTGMLAGLDETEVQKRVFDWTQRFIAEVKEEMEKL